MDDNKTSQPDVTQEAQTPDVTAELPAVKAGEGGSKPPKVRSKEDVRKDVAKKLIVKDDEGESDRNLSFLDAALDKLYAEYEESDAMPTREGLAAELRATNWPDAAAIAATVEEMDPDPFLVKKNRKLAVGIIAALVAAAVIIGAAVALTGNNASDPEPEPAKTEQKAVAEDKSEKSTVKVEVKAEGAEAGATKVKVVAKDEDGNDAIPEKEIVANELTELGELPEGEYELYVTQAPVAEDGSTYKLPDEPTKFKVDGEGKDVPLTVTLEKLPKEEMTKEQLEKSAEILEQNGKSDAAASVKESASTAQSVPGSENSVQQAAPSQPSNSGGNGSSSNGGSSSNNNSGTSNGSSSGNSSSGGNSNGSGGSSSSGGSSATQPTQPSQPAHQHSWVEQTTTVHHDAVYQTVHHDAVYGSVTVCTDCGTPYPSKEHLKEEVLNGGNGGTKEIQQIIQDAYDEQVLVSAAWDETVVTGYKCSGCGATK